MTPEEKDLLLKDLCARLPYGVKVQYEDNVFDVDYISPMYEEIKLDIPDNYTLGISEVKPYLFPLSSMTDEQRNEFLNIQSEDRKRLLDALLKYKYEEEDKLPIIPSQKHIDWLNKNHFDYRGLIPMGLANDATNLNIY